MTDWNTSGEIARKARAYAITLAKEGALHRDIADKTEATIKALGGAPAFPMDVSINNVAAHDCPFINDERALAKGDVVKLDIGVHINGCVTDTAATVEIGTHNQKKLIQASEDALQAAIDIIKPGIEIYKIGQAIEETISSFGFNPIGNLSGHGVGLYIVHDPPTIPNYDNKDTSTLEEGQHIAIEPFATDGVGAVKDGKPAGIYRLLRIKPVRLPNARKLLTFIGKEYQTLPFCERWLTPRFHNVRFLLALLEREGILKQYTQLPEQSGGMVSQAEKTMEVGAGVLT